MWEMTVDGSSGIIQRNVGQMHMTCTILLSGIYFSKFMPESVCVRLSVGWFAISQGITHGFDEKKKVVFMWLVSMS